MHLCGCHHPILVANPFSGEKIQVPCGKCEACRLSRAYKWVSRLQDEMLCHKYVFFVTLTYDDDNLPRYYLDDDGECLVSTKYDANTGANPPIMVEDLRNSYLSKRDWNYVIQRLDHKLGLPHGSVDDLQKFFKRFNRYCNYHVTKTYKNFLYWFVCEIGPTTHRPHYHGLFFFDSDELARRFDEVLSASWSLGRRDAAQVVSEYGSANYVAQYLNCFANLPEVYQKIRSLRPFFLCSRKTVIGSLQRMDEEVQELFNRASPRRGVPDWRSHVYVDVPLLPALENRLFPKIARYSFLSRSDRTLLYGLYERAHCKDFEGFKAYCKSQILNAPSRMCDNMLEKYLRCITYDLPLSSPKASSALYRFYCITRRVCKQAAEFGVTLPYYVSKIESYYDRKDYFNLTRMYQFQIDYVDNGYSLPDLIHCYPEVYHDIYNGYDLPHIGYICQSFDTDYFPPLYDTSDYLIMHGDSIALYNKNTKVHRKNAYFDSDRMKDSALKRIIMQYNNSNLS